MSPYLLFKDDWKLYPHSIVDYDTKNESALRYVDLLDSMGVKNCLWPLALHQPHLRDVDPFDPFLDPITQTQIILESKYNPFYFVREILRFPPNAGNNFIEVEFNRANMSLWWCYLNHIDYFLVQIRQTGKTANMNGISLWFQQVGASNSLSTLFSKDGDLIKETIANLVRMRNALPEYLRPVDRKDTDNKTSYSNLTYGNRIICKQAQGNPDSALKVGRGITTADSKIDEVNFIKYNRISIPAMLGGTTAAKEQAIALGEPCANIFASTAGDLDTDSGKYGLELISSAVPWNDSFYDCANQTELLDMLRSKSRSEFSIMINGTWSHRQLGKTDKWLKERMGASHAKGEKAKQDFCNIWSRGSEHSPVDENIKDTLFEHKTAPLFVERIDKSIFTINWFKPESVVRSNEFRTRKKLAGCDTSKIVGRDGLGIVFLDISTLEVLGEFTVTRGSIEAFTNWFVKLFVLDTGFILIPENKDIWLAILDLLLVKLPERNIDPGRRIYSTIVDNKNKDERTRALYSEFCKNGTSISHYERYRNSFGFSTDKAKRDLIYGPVFYEALELTADLIRSEAIILQLMGLEVTSSGRIDHRSGHHDDLIISWLLCHWFLSYCNNLEHYGIPLSMVKRDIIVSKSEAVKSVVDTYMEREQAKIKEEIKELSSMNATGYVGIKIKARLEYLMAKVKEDKIEDIGSISQTKERAKTNYRRAVKSKKYR